MAAPTAPLRAWLLLAGIVLPAQEAPRLIVALHATGHAARVAGAALPQRILHPAVQFDGKAWKGLDPALQAGAPGLPAFLPWNGPKAQGGPLRVSLEVLAAEALHLPPAGLGQWFVAPAQGPAVPMRALGGLQTQWACLEGWGIQVDGPGMPGGTWLATTAPVSAGYFTPGGASGLPAGLWDQLRAGWRQADARALADWRRLDDRDPWRGLPRQAAQRFGGAEGAVQVQEATLPGGARLIWVAALRHLGQARPEAPECQAPTAVMVALVRVDPDRPPRILKADLSYQDCGEGWVPGPRERPFCWFEWQGKAYFLETQLGLESTGLGLFELPPGGGLRGPLAQGAGSGC